MIGVRDLTSHLLHVAKRMGVKENELIKVSFSKAVFISLAYCYKYGVNIRYDVLFKKSAYGASSRDVDILLGDRYSRRVNFKNAKESYELTSNEELDNVIVQMIEEELMKPLSFSKHIVNSDVFKDSNYKEKKEESFFSTNHLLLPMDSDQFWSLKEILLYAGINEEKINSDFDLRLPLAGNEYNAIEKYLALYNKTMNDENFKSRVTHKFTLDEIEELRRVPEPIINSVRLHGARRVIE